MKPIRCILGIHDWELQNPKELKAPPVYYCQRCPKAKTGCVGDMGLIGNFIYYEQQNWSENDG